MKKRLLPFSFLLFLSFHLFSQWTPKAIGVIPPNYEIADISIVSDQIIWATAIDWSVPNPVPADFVSIVLKSIDCGETWDTIYVEEAKGRFCWDIHAFDEDTACITTNSRNGNNSEWGIFRTTDGGHNWTEVHNDKAGGGWIHFFEDGMCGVSGFGDVAITSDGGLNWTNVTNIPPYQPGEIIGGNSWSNAIGTYGNSVWFGTDQGRIFKTEDKGQSWTANNTGLGPNTFLYSFGFIDNSNGIGVYDSGDVYKLASTTNGGGSWEDTGITDYIEVDAIPDSNIFMGMNYEIGQEVTAFSSGIDSTWIAEDTIIGAFGAVFLNPEIGWMPGSGTDTAIYKWGGEILCETVNIQEPVNNFSLDIYPNPTTHSFQFQLPSPITGSSEVSFFDAQGRLMERRTVTNREEIEVSHFPAGIYTLKLVEGNRLYTGKLIKH